MSGDARFARQEALFGAPGQSRLVGAHVVLIGLGGLGSHLAQQLAYLGIGAFTLVDDDRVEPSNLNRLVGAGPDDVDALKVDVAARLISTVNPAATITTVPVRVPAPPQVQAAVGDADVVVAGLDAETPRLQLTEWCAAAGVPYVDCSTEVDMTGRAPVYGGEVVVASGDGCLLCLQLLDQDELAREAMTPGQRAADERIYGVQASELAGSGPSVVTINGVVASLAATETMCLLTGLRPPVRHLRYRADLGTVARVDETRAPQCAYCPAGGGIPR